MADDVVPDRPPDIAECLRYFGEFVCDGQQLTLVTMRTSDLRRAADEIERLRGALQALVDATDGLEFIVYEDEDVVMGEARAAAVALLAGPGGET